MSDEVNPLAAEAVSASNSIWEQIQQWVPPSELEEVRLAIGESLINDVEGLLQELSILLDIWREYREATQAQEHEKRQKQRQDRLRRKKLLPEPPNVRERLEHEIKFFVASLKKQSVPIQRDAVVDFVVKQPDASSSTRSQSATNRPQTARSGEGEQPLRARSAGDKRRPRTARSLESVTIETLEGQKEGLKQLLLEEKAALEEDILFMQRCIGGEHDYRVEVMESNTVEGEVPSLAALRQARAMLESTYMASINPTHTVISGLTPMQPPAEHSATNDGNTCSRRSGKDKSVATKERGREAHSLSRTTSLGKESAHQPKRALPPIRVPSGGAERREKRAVMARPATSSSRELGQVRSGTRSRHKMVNGQEPSSNSSSNSNESGRDDRIDPLRSSHRPAHTVSASKDDVRSSQSRSRNRHGSSSSSVCNSSSSSSRGDGVSESGARQLPRPPSQRQKKGNVRRFAARAAAPTSTDTASAPSMPPQQLSLQKRALPTPPSMQ